MDLRRPDYVTYNKGKGEAIGFLRKHLAYEGNDCVLSPFSINPESGYSYMGFEGNIWRAHRLMCILAHGKPTNPKLEAAHSCHKPACINPSHLSWKTHAQNIRDKRLNGTHVAHTNGRKGKITPFQVQEIKDLEGKKTQVEIGRIYGLSEASIRNIHQGKTWRKLRAA